MPLESSTISPLQVTPAARARIKKMLKEAGKGVGIRLATEDKGCSGKGYVISLIETIPEEDYLFPLENSVVLSVDRKSYEFLKGTVIDYERKGLNRQWVFHNPQSKAACGCGESFYV